MNKIKLVKIEVLKVVLSENTIFFSATSALSARKQKKPSGKKRDGLKS